MMVKSDKIYRLIFITATLPFFLTASMLIIQLTLHTPDIMIILQVLEIEIFLTATLPFLLASWLYKENRKK